MNRTLRDVSYMSSACFPTRRKKKKDALVVEVEKELVVEALNVLDGRDNRLQVLVLILSDPETFAPEAVSDNLLDGHRR